MSFQKSCECIVALKRVSGEKQKLRLRDGNVSRLSSFSCAFGVSGDIVPFVMMVSIPVETLMSARDQNHNVPKSWPANSLREDEERIMRDTLSVPAARVKVVLLASVSPSCRHLLPLLVRRLPKSNSL
jgi:hypothetical protein